MSALALWQMRMMIISSIGSASSQVTRREPPTDLSVAVTLRNDLCCMGSVVTLPTHHKKRRHGKEDEDEPPKQRARHLARSNPDYVWEGFGNYKAMHVAVLVGV